MTRKRKYKRLYERIVIVWLLIILATLWLLMAKTANAAGGESVLNEVVIPMIETYEPSVEVDKMLYSRQNEAEVYDNTPEEETTETAEIEAMAVSQDYRTTENETESTCAKIVQVQNENGPASEEWVYPLTESELRLIALIAELEDREAMQEIAEVILNRALSPKFPDSIEEIIFQPKQFHTVGLITDDMMPGDEAVQAVTVVFRDGQSTVGDSLFFAERSIPCGKIAKGLYLEATAGETAFWGQE